MNPDTTDTWVLLLIRLLTLAHHALGSLLPRKTDRNRVFVYRSKRRGESSAL